MQQKAKEEQERELDAKDTPVQQQSRGILKLDVVVQLMLQVRRRWNQTCAHVDLGLVVWQGQKDHDRACDEQDGGEDEEEVVDVESMELARFDVDAATG